MNRIYLLSLVVAAFGCGRSDADEAPVVQAEMMDAPKEEKMGKADDMRERAMPAAPATTANGMGDELAETLRSIGGVGTRGGGGHDLALASPKSVSMNESMKKRVARKPAGPGRKGAASAEEAPADDGPAAPTRSWFPETFLFAPRVITNAVGEASVDVLVPDRLTTWRVLALAHSRNGMQAGTTTTLVGNLPVSIDLVVPPYLVAGDRVALPIQVVNTTGEALARTISAKAEGGSLGALPGGGAIRVEGGGTATSTAWLEVRRPGELLVEANVGKDDAVRRTVPVEAGGDPKRSEKSGTLAAARTFELPVGAGVIPGSARAALQVFPGALSVLRAELAAAPDRGSLDDEGYLLNLTARARPLAAQLQATVDETQLLRMTRIATQRTARRALSPELYTAMKLAPGAALHSPDTLLGRHGENLAAFVARAQRPDGTFGGGDGWPVQRLLMSTAEGLHAVRAAQHTDQSKLRAAAASLRARGAFERFSGQIDDPYTAAVLLRTGVIEAPLKDELQKKVADALKQEEDGSRTLPVPEAVVRADGSGPTQVEATAYALLALADHAPSEKLLPDLGAFVLAAYRPGRGFGDGATNRVALDAVAFIFDDPLPAKVVVSLTVNGKVVGSEALEGARLQEVLTIDAPVEAEGPMKIEVKAEPPVPGLSYLVALDYAVPWPAPAADAGVEFVVELPKLTVGVPADVKLRSTAPDGSGLVVTHGLPAGVDPVKPSLEALVSSGAISSFTIKEGFVEMTAPGRRQGELFEITYKVVPTLAGTLHPRIASVRVQNRGKVVHFPPAAWTIGR